MVWGPSGPVWQFPIYLLALPVFVWLMLRWIWRSWQPTPIAEDRVCRVIASGIAVAAVVGAVLALTATQEGTVTFNAYVDASGNSPIIASSSSAFDFDIVPVTDHIGVTVDFNDIRSVRVVPATAMSIGVLH